MGHAVRTDGSDACGQEVVPEKVGHSARPGPVLPFSTFLFYLVLMFSLCRRIVFLFLFSGFFKSSAFPFAKINL